MEKETGINLGLLAEGMPWEKHKHLRTKDQDSRKEGLGTEKLSSEKSRARDLCPVAAASRCSAMLYHRGQS